MADAIESYLKDRALPAQAKARPFESFERYLQENPGAPWRVALATNLAIASRKSGYFSRVFGHADMAWREGADSENRDIRALASRAFAEKAELLARLGRGAELAELLQGVEGRDFSGAVSEKMTQVRESLWLLQNRPEDAYRCGPLAVGAMLRELQGREDGKVDAAKSTEQGTSLRQMRDLASSVGLKVRMAHREVSGGVVPTPSMVHWKTGHFAALTRREGSRYLRW